jgi:hypothetical protein
MTRSLSVHAWQAWSLATSCFFFGRTGFAQNFPDVGKVHVYLCCLPG